MDENNIEDVDTKGEDHVYDESCHVCMARPLSSIQPKVEIRRPPKDMSAVAAIEVKQRWAEVDESNLQEREPF